MGNNVVHDLNRLADTQTTDRKSVEPDGHRVPGAFVPQGLERAPLHDTELRLTGIRHLAIQTRRMLAGLEKSVASSARPP